MANITLTPPPYEYLHRHPEMDQVRFYQNLKWLGRECYSIFGGDRKMTAQKVHTAIWKTVIGDLEMRHGSRMGVMSKVMLMGYHGDNDRLDVSIRSEHGKFKVTTCYTWERHTYDYVDIVSNVTGKSYWDLYTPRSKPTPMDF